MDGELIDSEIIKKLANLPTMDELRAKIISLLSASATKIAGILTRPGGQLAQVINAKSQLPETINPTVESKTEETAAEEIAAEEAVIEDTEVEETAPDENLVEEATSEKETD